jgi:hypothetical protein
VKWEKEVLKKSKVESTDGQRSGVHVGSSPASSQVLRKAPEGEMEVATKFFDILGK